MRQSSGLFGALERYSDLLLAFVVVCILSILVIKVPQGVMDVLIATNISAAIMILLVALYVPDAVKLPSFPTILLLTTLFRLALNVSTTRLILLDADAGEIIQAFGNFVVGGNYVVGGVVFLVLVLIQFIVIAKGSERVAEVSARFTLDAMPGKQMSIDADARSGMISQDEARERRTLLERESKLYGAMDGAMKFVKGDAIAGIVISVVNILGGLVIGIMQQGMTGAEAAETYSLLTIGDGLVSQIPALLISVSAGLVVTRVAGSEGEGEKSNLGRDLIDQTLGNAKALAVVAVILLVLGFTADSTGFPRGPFLVLGGLAAFIAFVRWTSPSPEEMAAETAGPGAEQDPMTAPDDPQAQTAPPALVLEIGSALVPFFLEKAPGSEQLVSREATLDRLRRLRDSLSREVGIVYPPIALRVGTQLADPSSYTILAYDAPIARGRFPADRILVLGEAEELSGNGFDAEQETLPGTRALFASVPRSQAAQVKKAKLRAKGPEDLVLNHLRVALKQHASEFLGIQESHTLLDALRERAPELIKALLQTELTLQQVTEVLKNLLDQRVPIQDLRRIVESLAKWGCTDKNTQMLAERIRQDLSRLLCTRYAEAGQTIYYYDIGGDIVQLLADSRQPTLAQIEEQRRILPSIRAAIDFRAHVNRDPVLLVHADVRWMLWNLIRHELPEVIVMSHAELTPEVQVEPIGFIMLQAPEMPEFAEDLDE